MTPSDNPPAREVEMREIAENIRFFAQDLLTNGHLFGAQISGVMAIRDEADKLLALSPQPSRPQGEEGLAEKVGRVRWIIGASPLSFNPEGRIGRIGDILSDNHTGNELPRPEVLAFAHLMEAQLRANDHKPGWAGENPWPLLERLFEEAEELRDELEPGTRSSMDVWHARLGAEAADVANFAMMIADVCGALSNQGKPSS